MSVLLYARLIQVDQPRSVIQYYTFNNLRTSGFISAIPFDHGNVNFGGFPIPQKFSDALLLSAHLQQKVEEQEAKIEEDKPKVEYYSGMVENRDYFTTTTIATELRTTSQVLNQFLCKKGVLTGKSGSWKVTDEHQTLLSPSPFKSIIRWNHEGRTLIHQLWEERVEELARLVGLEDRLNAYPSQLSGGEKQRVAIARALINSPKILLADEPTGNLDEETSEMIFKILKDINKNEKQTIIVVTHSKDLAEISDKQLYLKKGVLVEE